MTYTEKVVGTTFANIDIDAIFPRSEQEVAVTNENEIPEKTFEARIIAESENPYDNNAKAVVILIPNGFKVEQHRIGYIKRDSPLYNKLKNMENSYLKATVKMKAFSIKGMYDSYIVNTTVL